MTEEKYPYILVEEHQKMLNDPYIRAIDSILIKIHAFVIPESIWMINGIVEHRYKESDKELIEKWEKEKNRYIIDTYAINQPQPKRGEG